MESPLKIRSLLKEHPNTEAKPKDSRNLISSNRKQALGDEFKQKGATAKRKEETPIIAQYKNSMP